MTNQEVEIISNQIKQIGDRGIFFEMGNDLSLLVNSVGKKFPNWKFITSQDFENLDFVEKVDIVRISVLAKKPQNEIPLLVTNKWQKIFDSAMRILKDKGIAIACNYDHVRYGNFVKQSIKNNCFTEIENFGNIVILRNNPIRFGSYETFIDINYHNQKSIELLNSDKVKSSGLNNHNTFINILPEDKKSLSNHLNSMFNSIFEWNFEYFKSGEPAGLHTDYNSIPNSWKEKVDGKVTHDCHLVVGIIIPLEWNCKQPYTINYNRVSNVPRKLKYKNGEMRYLDNDEIFDYRSTWEYDDQVLKYNPKKTEYYKEYADLKVHSVYEWKIGSMLVFDTRRWHSSSWFLSTDTVPEISTEYKKSIIGFGSIDVDRDPFYD